MAIMSVALLGGCALQPAYLRPALEMPASWSGDPAVRPEQSIAPAGDWWRLLGDPAINQLVAAGLSDNPTLAEAAARIDRSRAALGQKEAERQPAVGFTAGAARSRDRTGSATTGQSSAETGASLSWEIDLWGRVHAGADAARSRLAARTADAQGARLSVAADIVDTTLALRACNLALEIRNRDIRSRETELEISRARLSLGSVAPVVLATAKSNLAAARTDLASQQEACIRHIGALVALSGMQANAVRQLVPPGLSPFPDDPAAMIAAHLPKPPPYAPALPATVLLAHPQIVAAEREVAARWSEIGIARAERLPRVDLTAALTGQWIGALGSGASFVSGSIGAALAGPLFDGGAGAARVRGAEALYREAVAQLAGTVRLAIRDVEDGLAARLSASQRMETTREALEAARFAFRANEARWRAGAISQYELEESRRQYDRSQEGVIYASADRAKAWVMLVRRTGGGFDTDARSQPLPLAEGR